MKPASRRIAMAVTVATVLGTLRVSAAEQPPFISRHHLEGQVEGLDRKAGTFTVSTRAGTLQFDAPGPAARLAKGSGVAVELAIFRGRPPLAAPAGDEILLRKRMDARVTHIDRATGSLRLAWSEGWLRVDVPGRMLQTFKKGDRVPIELVLAPAAPAAASPLTDPDRKRRGALATFLLGILGRK
jgi:hypothetical protein